MNRYKDIKTFGIIDSNGSLTGTVKKLKTTVRTTDDDIYWLIDDYWLGIADKKSLQSVRLTPWLPAVFKMGKIIEGAQYGGKKSKQVNLWSLLESVRNGRTIKKIPERHWNTILKIKDSKPMTGWGTLCKRILKDSHGRVDVKPAYLKNLYFKMSPSLESHEHH